MKELIMTNKFIGSKFIGKKLLNLIDDQSQWSQETFGSDDIKGPIGALKHLKKEADECLKDPSDIKEYVDCLLLILDASRRAGFNIIKLLDAAEDKMVENKLRVWPKIDDMDAFVEHVK